MTYINHYTVNTNHNNSFNFDDINIGMLAVIKTSIDSAVGNFYTEVFDGIYWNLKVENDWYISTLSQKSEKEEYVPFLITVGCVEENSSNYAMSTIKKVYKAFFDDEVTVEPTVPYVCSTFYPTFSSKEKMEILLGAMVDFNTTLFWYLFGDRKFTK